MSAKQGIYDKFQGSVATCLRCGRVVNNQIKIGLLFSLCTKIILKSLNIWQNCKQERYCLVHFRRLLVRDLQKRKFFHTMKTQKATT